MTTWHLSYSLFRSLRTVQRTALTTFSNSLSIKGTTNDMIANTRQVLYAASSNQHHWVFLKIMTFTRDIADYFRAVRQTDTCHFTQSGVRFLRGRCINPCTNTSFCGQASKAGTLFLFSFGVRDLRINWLIVGITNFLKVKLLKRLALKAPRGFDFHSLKPRKSGS